MPEDNTLDFQPNILTLYRELGQLEGRIDALEETTKEIKTLLTSINTQLASIQTNVSTALGQKQGSEKAYGSLGYIANFVISAITAYFISRTGK